MRGRNPSADSGAGPYSGDAEGGSMPPSAPSPWDGRKAINPSSFVSKFVELDPFCSFVRTIQYAIDFGGCRIHNSASKGHGAVALTRASTKELAGCLAAPDKFVVWSASSRTPRPSGGLRARPLFRVGSVSV